MRLACAILFLSVSAFADPLADKIYHIGWRTNYQVHPNLAMRGPVSIPITNIVSRVFVFRLAPNMPLFTNVVAISTNVSWTKPLVKPVHSPKTKP